MSAAERMTTVERRATFGLASIFGLRMLGMFLILPVFAIHAQHLPGGDDHTLVGLALGAYGLTQAMLQLPFGMASDRFGRKRVIFFGLLLFILGSIVAALATDVQTVVIGRAIQGAGAISAAVMALLADLTREEHRTHAMAMIGSTIGLTFAFSLAAGPALYRWLSVPGIFALTAVLGTLALWVVWRVIPDPQASHFHSDAEVTPATMGDVLRHRGLLRLNLGIFTLHAVQMAMFVVLPLKLVAAGLDTPQHWTVYLPVVLLAFALAVPAIVIGERRGKLKHFFVAAVLLLLLSQALAPWVLDRLWGGVAVLALFFIAFNVLEATLPSLVSKLAPARAKGTAIGVYNTSQALGVFVGGVLGGGLAERFGTGGVFGLTALLALIWLVVAVTMPRPPAVRTRMYHVEALTAGDAPLLEQALAGVRGVREVSVLADEGAVTLKVDLAGWDEEQVLQLINKGK